MYRTVQFESTFANEWRFDANEFPVAPGARDLAEAIVGELGKRVSGISAVEQHSFYGWAFEARYAGCRFINVVNPAEPVCYLTIHLCWYWLRAVLLQRPRRVYDEYCVVVSEALAAIPQVSGVRWEGYRR
jgi:hypothetical protein